MCVCVRIQIRPSELKLPEGELAFARPALGSKAATGVVTSTDRTRVLHASRVGFVKGSWCWGVVESNIAREITVGFGGGVRGKMFVLEADRGRSASAVDQLAVLNDVAHGRRCCPGDAVLCVVLHSDVANKVLVLSSARAAAAVAAAQKALSGISKSKALDDAAVASALAAARDSLSKQDVSAQPGCVTFGVVVGPTKKKEDDSQDTRVVGLSMRVQLTPSVSATVCATHSNDRAHWSDHPFHGFNVGQVVRGVVLPVSGERGNTLRRPQKKQKSDEEVPGSDGGESEASAAEENSDTDAGAGSGKKRSTAPANKPALMLSLRQSLVAQAASAPSRSEAVAALRADLDAEQAMVQSVGGLVSGFVEETSKKGCFVRVCLGWRARSLLKDLSDGFVKELSRSFPSGKLVAGRVLAVDSVAKTIDLSLKGSAVTGTRTLLADAAPSADTDTDTDDDSESDVEVVGVPRPQATAAGSDGSESDSENEDNSGSESEGSEEETVVAPVQQKATKRPRFDWNAETPADEDTKADSDGWSSDGDGDADGAHAGRRARASAKKRLEAETGIGVLCPFAHACTVARRFSPTLQNAKRSALLRTTSFQNRRWTSNDW